MVCISSWLVVVDINYDVWVSSRSNLDSLLGTDSHRLSR
jgi:hypothetical protein